ncbi:MAG: hypothetical protein KAR55_06420 [Thermoplasmatales archaeon]|nr:hypothetical protein [Thermoplasmatales archaeon]
MERSILHRKGIVSALIILFIFMSVIQSFGTIAKKSNKLIFSENSAICGFTTDFETGEPIEEANICFFIHDDQGNHYDYETWSNETGFYIIENVAAGYCHEYGAHASGYHFYWTGNIDIGENETVWVNMSMYPRQPETSKVCGYVIDNLTGECIYDAPVYTMWFDIHGQLTYNGTYSKENGFYSINLGPGYFSVETAAEAYINQIFFWDDLGDNETVWFNFSLDPEITIEIIKPKNGIYFKNKMIFPFYFPIIIGPVDIEINVILNGGDPIDHVEILIDGISKYNFTSEPYIYYWNEKAPLRFRHEMEVIAHRKWDSDASKELMVWKFF